MAAAAATGVLQMIAGDARVLLRAFSPRGQSETRTDRVGTRRERKLILSQTPRFVLYNNYDATGVNNDTVLKRVYERTTMRTVRSDYTMVLLTGTGAFVVDLRPVYLLWKMRLSPVRRYILL